MPSSSNVNEIYSTENSLIPDWLVSILEGLQCTEFGESIAAHPNKMSILKAIRLLHSINTLQGPSGKVTIYLLLIAPEINKLYQVLRLLSQSNLLDEFVLYQLFYHPHYQTIIPFILVIAPKVFINKVELFALLFHTEFNILLPLLSELNDLNLLNTLSLKAVMNQPNILDLYLAVIKAKDSGIFNNQRKPNKLFLIICDHHDPIVLCDTLRSLADLGVKDLYYALTHRYAYLLNGANTRSNLHLLNNNLTDDQNQDLFVNCMPNDEVIDVSKFPGRFFKTKEQMEEMDQASNILVNN